MFLLIAFNKELNKSQLFAISLIQNENKETFNEIYKYLTENFGFNPNIISCDCNQANIIAIRKLYPNTRIIG